MTHTKGRILFLYPNSEGYGGVPNGIALLSGCLKAAGYSTRCFDTTFLNSPPITLLQREKHGGTQKIDSFDLWGKWTPKLAKKIPILLKQTLSRFQPHLIAVSHVDVGFNYMKTLLKKVKAHTNAPIVAGGITCTTSPELVIKEENIDIVCVGEGEEALVELADTIVLKKDYSNIKNLWVKKDGQIIKNSIRPLIDMDTLPFQDWSIFDERHYYKPYCGKFQRTGFFELARGCHFNCTFCCAGRLRELYRGKGKYARTRSIDKTLDEINYLKKKYNLEIVFFIDDDFLGMPAKRFDYFIQEYKKRIDLPFYIQTRCETIKENYVKKLKEINISTIAIGVEHGNEEYRKKYLNRKMSNHQLQQAFDLVHKYDIRSTANIIIGMPNETEELFKDTVLLLQKLKPRSVSISFFQPFRGIPMRQMAVDLGLIPPEHVVSESNTCLDLPGFPAKRIKHYYKNFKKYLEGSLTFN